MAIKAEWLLDMWEIAIKSCVPEVWSKVVTNKEYLGHNLSKKVMNSQPLQTANCPTD
jgi:hypothetical protein